MARPSTPRRPSAQGIKSLISVAAVAATLGGWAILADPSPAPTTVAAPMALSDTLPAIPTVVSLVQQQAPFAPTRPDAVTVTRSSR